MGVIVAEEDDLKTACHVLRELRAGFTSERAGDDAVVRYTQGIHDLNRLQFETLLATVYGLSRRVVELEGARRSAKPRVRVRAAGRAAADAA